MPTRRVVSMRSETRREKRRRAPLEVDAHLAAGFLEHPAGAVVDDLLGHVEGLEAEHARGGVFARDLPHDVDVFVEVLGERLEGHRDEDELPTGFVEERETEGPIEERDAERMRVLPGELRPGGHELAAEREPLLAARLAGLSGQPLVDRNLRESHGRIIAALERRPLLSCGT